MTPLRLLQITILSQGATNSVVQFICIVIQILDNLFLCITMSFLNDIRVKGLYTIYMNYTTEFVTS